MDKTRFRVGCSSTYWVIILNLEKPILSIDLDNREYITLVESINDRGKTILAILIL